ncbi:MAG: tetratricopeptide repeat protein [Bacteroidetes bacterium]|nr:tetratricopeptide repeat protein [Bacteroidota bacterium]
MTEGENWDKAEEVLEKIKSKYGEDESTIEKQITLLGSTKQIEKMLTAIEDAYKAYPENYTFVNLKFLIENKVRKNSSEAEKVLKKYIEKRKSTNAMGDLLDQYLETNNVSGALSTLEKMIDLNPYAIGYISKMARIQYSLGNYKKAHEYNQICHTIAPYIGSYDELAGDIFDAEKKTNDARQSYKRAITYSPTNYDAREKLRKLDDKPEIFEPFGKPDFQKIYKSSPSADAYPEDNSIILVDEDQKVIYKGGASVERTFLMVKVFNTSGIDTWKEYNIPQYSGQRLVVDDAYIIKKNGSKVDADKNENQIAFTTLEVGDAICLSYKIENYYTGKLAQNFSEIHYFNYFFPVMRSSYQLLVDTSVSIYYKMKNSNLQVQTKNIDEFKLYTWVETNKPALEFRELHHLKSAIYRSFGGRVTTFKEWDDVSKWYSEISSSKAKPDYELKELMHELFDGKGKMTDLEKRRICTITLCMKFVTAR